MERDWATAWDDRDREGARPSDDFALPSRAVALRTLRDALEAGGGPVLVTGEAGVGKTWLCRQARDAMPAPWRWAVVDLSPATTPGVFYRAIGHAIGLEAPDGPVATRLDLGDFLLEAAADGDRWILVADEAHAAPADVLEEARILANRLGRPDGLAGLVLVGQTSLSRRLATRPLAAIGSRLSARVHLGPLDIDEARRLVGRLAPGSPRYGAGFERLHRDVRGNPRRLVRWAQDVAAASARSQPSAPSSDRLAPDVPAAIAPEARRETSWEMPPAVPSRPPLRVEDGLIEVGWEPPRTTTSPAGPAAEARMPGTGAISGAEEPIDDHYAALQAWDEWARNRGEDPSSVVAGAIEEPEEGGPQAAPEPDDLDVWVEGEHGFAPYSQLFSRLRQPRETS
jgi:type II secretory pathway predicted ATPase ExeA